MDDLANEAVYNYIHRVEELHDEFSPMPWAFSMSRLSIIERLQRAADAELSDPPPPASWDGGGVSGL